MTFEPSSEVSVGLLQTDFIQCTSSLHKIDLFKVGQEFYQPGEFALEQRFALHGHGIIDGYEKVWCLISYIADPYL